jgi:hypothetical protein
MAKTYSEITEELISLVTDGYNKETITQILYEHLVLRSEHGIRVTELLRYNSEQVIQRRVANAKLRIALKALQICRDTLRDYARQHRAKDTVDGSVKALKNDTIADMCDEAMNPDINPQDYGRP